MIKTWLSRHYEDQDRFKPNAARIRKKQQAIWQYRFWEHILRDEQDLEKHVDYIHSNPVKHAYAKRPIDWTYSSIHRYVEQGILTLNWGESTVAFDPSIGRE